MTNKQLKRQLVEAAAALHSHMPFDRIAQAIPPKIEDASAVGVHRRPIRRYMVAAVAACLIAVLGLGGLWLTKDDTPDPPTAEPLVVKGHAVIDIDINPSVEIAVDSADRIIGTVAVNDDGQQVLEGLKLTEKPLSDGVQSLLQAMVTHGYVAETGNAILVTVQSADPAEADRLHNIVNDGVDAVMTQHEMTASVTNQTVEAFDKVAQFAQKHGISNGKAAFILSLVEQQPTLDAEALTDHAFSVLAAIAQHQNVPLGELVDYDATDGLWEDILNALTAELTEAEHRWGSMLSVSEVKERALKALPNEYIAENALVVRIDFSWEEEEEPVYRIELVSLGYLYEYTIHARDGSFLNPGGSTTTANPHSTVHSTLEGGGTRVPLETKPTKPSETTAEPTRPAVSTTVPSATNTTQAKDGVGRNEAKQIVLSYFHIQAEDTQHLSVGEVPARREWSVYFIYNETINVTYVHQTTGEITATVLMPLDMSAVSYAITEWDALRIALQDCGVEEGEYRELTLYFYTDAEGTPCIAVFFNAGYRLYDYRVNGVDGSIASRSITPIGVGGSTPPTFLVP